MGFWNKLGKIALTAAPYVGALFTGGGSLAFAPAANRAVEAWSAHDAKKNAEKGLGPSNFDRYLGMAGNVASLGSSMGAFGKTAQAGMNPAAGSTASKVANTANAASGIFNRIPSNQSVQTGQSVQREPSQQTYDDMTSSPIGPSREAIPTAGVMPQGGFSWNQNPMNQFNQSSPNLSMALHQGREEAIMNQPWRGGYQVNTQGPEEGQVITTEMPEMFPNNRRRSA